MADPRGDFMLAVVADPCVDPPVLLFPLPPDGILSAAQRAERAYEIKRYFIWRIQQVQCQ